MTEFERELTLTWKASEGLLPCLPPFPPAHGPLPPSHLSSTPAPQVAWLLLGSPKRCASCLSYWREVRAAAELTKTTHCTLLKSVVSKKVKTTYEKLLLQQQGVLSAPRRHQLPLPMRQRHTQPALVQTRLLPVLVMLADSQRAPEGHSSQQWGPHLLMGKQPPPQVPRAECAQDVCVLFLSYLRRIC